MRKVSDFFGCNQIFRRNVLTLTLIVEWLWVIGYGLLRGCKREEGRGFRVEALKDPNANLNPNLN